MDATGKASKDTASLHMHAHRQRLSVSAKCFILTKPVFIMQCFGDILEVYVMVRIWHIGMDICLVFILCTQLYADAKYHSNCYSSPKNNTRKSN